MKKKERNSKLFFRRKRHSKTDEEFQIISDEELFEDVADYEEEQTEETEDLPGDEDHEGSDLEESSDNDESAEPEEGSLDTGEMVGQEAEPSGADEGNEPDEEAEDLSKDMEDQKLKSDGKAETVQDSEDIKKADALENTGEDKGTDIEEDVKDSEDTVDVENSRPQEGEDGREQDEEEERGEDMEETEEDTEEDTEGSEDDFEEVSWESEDDDEDFEESEEGFEEDDDIKEIDLDDDAIKNINRKDKKDKKDSGKQELSDEEKALKKQRRKKRVRIALLVILGIFATAYLGAAGFFYSHFYLNTQINGADFSLNNVAQVQDYMEQQVDDYDLKYVRDDSVDKLLKKQNPLLWITALWETPVIDASVGVEYDKKKLDGVVANLVCMREEEQVPSVSACPVFVETQFEIQEEKLGTQIDYDRFPAAVAEAINSFSPELDMTEAECYIPPVFTTESPEVAAARDAMNGYLGANVTLDFSPYTEVIDSQLIAQWIVVDENMQVVFNQDAVRGYVASLAEKYDTFGKPRTFTTGFGNAVQVSGGSYGWQIDQEAEFNALIANIQNAETVTREPNYARRAVSHEGNDFGNTYAEVDLTNQHMFYFQDGQCILQSNIVTGNPNKGNGTPQGVYTLAYKTMHQVLRGTKLPDGTYEYESPVTYWMPFNGGIGFHDASWQSAFGGSRYLTYGSHGCVNMPAGAAGQLYGVIQAGTPVICHY